MSAGADALRSEGRRAHPETCQTWSRLCRATWSSTRRGCRKQKMQPLMRTSSFGRRSRGQKRRKRRRNRQRISSSRLRNSSNVRRLKQRQPSRSRPDLETLQNRQLQPNKSWRRSSNSYRMPWTPHQERPMRSSSWMMQRSWLSRSRRNCWQRSPLGTRPKKLTPRRSRPPAMLRLRQPRQRQRAVGWRSS